jgi:tetratricopeptide (TPR) repeat protein
MTEIDAIRHAYREKRFADAGRQARDWLQRNPEDAEAWRLLGLALAAAGEFAPAIQSYGKALSLRPEFFEVRFHRGNALRLAGDLEGALADYTAALSLRPEHSASWNNRGIALLEMGRHEEALQSFDRALELQPDHVGALNNRGNVLQQLHRYLEAVACYDRALALQPDHPDSAAHRAFLELLAGDLPQGWERFEARRWRDSWKSSAPDFPGPELSSLEAAQGKRVLIYCEQGLGDTIQFCRYAQMLADHALEVFLLPQPKLPRLLRGLKEVRVLGNDDLLSATCDCHIPLLSLPRLFRTDVHSIPAEVPYLSAEPDRVERFRQRIGTVGFRIGIAWQGNPSHPLDRHRSFGIDALAPLAGIPGIRLISLQKHHGNRQLETLPAGLQVETLGEDFDSGPHAFLDAAAAMQSCDLVLTCDTSIGHLAGALGRPVWIGLAAVPDWRWRLASDQSAWYPTARLFRQSQPGDWQDVFQRIAAKLKSR